MFEAALKNPHKTEKPKTCICTAVAFMFVSVYICILRAVSINRWRDKYREKEL